MVRPRGIHHILKGSFNSFHLIPRHSAVTQKLPGPLSPLETSSGGAANVPPDQLQGQLRPETIHACRASSPAGATQKANSWTRTLPAAYSMPSLLTQGSHMATSAGPAAGSSKGQKQFLSADLVIKKSTQAQPPSEDLSNLRFGAQFSPHMLTITWSAAQGWGAPLISPLEPIPMHPASQVLHYGMGCFEGMKVYKGRDGSVRMFRPDMNMQRMALSCQRLCLPPFSQEELIACIKELLRVDADWIPKKDGFSMYLRPFAMATTPFLGVGPPSDVMLCVMMSPAGPYFPDGLRPISLLVDTAHVRAYPGGVGDRKVAGNYAPTILPQVEAAKKGCSQVLYVLQDSGMGEDSDGWVGESGAMNVFFLLRRPGTTQLELVTPPLDGLILPGVTRDSVLGLASEWAKEGQNLQVSERPMRLSELKTAHREGRLLEIFGTGTAVIVQPISSLVLGSGSQLSVAVDEKALAYWTEMEPGKAHLKPTPAMPFSFAGRMYRALLDIQYGHREHPWSIAI